MAKRLLRRLLPDSLFGRLVLTFSVSFLAILFVGMLHAHQSKNFYSIRGTLSFRTRNMAEIALLLDNATPENRPLILSRMSARGLDIDVVPVLPDLGITPPPLQDEANLMRRLLNVALADIWNPQPQGETMYDRMEEVWEGDDNLYAEPGRVAMFEMNAPTFMDDLATSLRRSFTKRPPDKKARPDGPPLCRAVAAVPLSDGTWAVFHDQIPMRSVLPGLPLKGILSMEIFFVLISLFAFYLIIKPLRNLTRAADNLGRDIPGAPPLPETGPKEVREGAQAFNRMQRRIRDFVDQRSSALAAVSHDLRTPLTRMRLRVEQLDEQARAPLQKDMNALQQMVDTALDLARSGTNEVPARLDVASLIESLVEDRQDLGQDVLILNPDSLSHIRPLFAPPLSVKRCLNNILDNAVCYGNGKVDIAVRDGRHELSILIHDHGPGIPEDALEKVFDPFFRLEPSRNRATGGSGLGLAIARTMARSQGGDITLTNHPDGGLLATITFARHGK